MWYLLPRSREAEATRVEMRAVSGNSPISLPPYSADESSHSPDPGVETQAHLFRENVKVMPRACGTGSLSLTSLGHTVYDRCCSHILVIQGKCPQWRAWLSTQLNQETEAQSQGWTYQVSAKWNGFQVDIHEEKQGPSHEALGEGRSTERPEAICPGGSWSGEDIGLKPGSTVDQHDFCWADATLLFYTELVPLHWVLSPAQSDSF